MNRQAAETDARAAALRDFLAASGWGDAAIAPLAGDASNRRYLRLHDRNHDAVLMDAPPERGEDTRPFIAMTEWLRSIGLSAPELYAADADRGFLILEDLGDTLYARHLSDSVADEALLYRGAVSLLRDISDHVPPATIDDWPLAPYDTATLLREAELLTDWYLPGATGTPTPPDLSAEYAALITDATTGVCECRDVVVLRDYHAENLLWLPDRAGPARVGLLDYQDALAGHPAYDLVSLLEDARRDTSAALRTAMIAAYLDMRPDLDPAAFRADYAVLGAQRNLKIVGIFARLARRDGKPAYLSLIPRVWGHLQRDLAHPALDDLAAWIARHVPAPEPAVLDRIASRAPA